MAQSTSVCKIFVSSTFEDMKPYRNAVTDAITSLEHLPIGMEHFVSSPDKSLDVCLSDVRRCNIYVLLVGMRYGSIDNDTGKSYTELEYDEAIRYNIPVLAFIIDENECPVLPKFFDDGDKADKLKAFKKRLYDSHMASRFKSADDLKQLAIRAIETQVKKISEENNAEANSSTADEYAVGSNIYKKFLILPERYKNNEVFLRLRVEGVYGSWKQRDVLFEAYDLRPGDALRINDVISLGADLSDIDSEGCYLDLYAEGKAADWLLDNEVGRGSIFEGKFRLMYEVVRDITSHGDAKMAALLLTEGVSVTNKKRKSR